MTAWCGWISPTTAPARKTASTPSNRRLMIRRVNEERRLASDGLARGRPGACRVGDRPGTFTASPRREVPAAAVLAWLLGRRIRRRYADQRHRPAPARGRFRTARF